MNLTLLHDSCRILQARLGAIRPHAGLILGSGWSDIAKDWKQEAAIPYSALPAMGATTVPGHIGQLLACRVGGQVILIFQGRRHWYEGCGWEPIAFPLLALKTLGAETVVLTNAAGGIRTDLQPGTLMRITDHINAMGVNPLIGPHAEEWGLRFPDMTRVYDRELGDLLDRAAARAGQPLARGIYLAVTGPQYETPAEVRVFGQWGADAVGSSTVPEAMLAHAAGLRVIGLSCIANQAAGLGAGGIAHAQVADITGRAVGAARAILDTFWELLS